MRTRAITDSLSVTEVGFGAAGVSNLYSAISDAQAAATLEAAWDGGIRYFDVAPHYGLGIAERRLGRALAGKPRSQYTISTKVGRLLVPRVPAIERDDDLFDVPGDLTRRWDFSPAGIRRSITESLERMGVDHIDIAYLHDPDVAPIPNALAKGLTALLALREEGLVRAVGVGTNDSATAARAFREFDIDTSMIAGRYTLLRNEGFDDVLEAAGNRSVVLAGVFNSGILAQDEVPQQATFDYFAAPAEVLDHARAIATLASEHSATLPELAIGYGLRPPQVASVVLGMRSPAEVEENLARYRAPVPASAWEALTRVQASFNVHPVVSSLT